MKLPILHMVLALCIISCGKSDSNKDDHSPPQKADPMSLDAKSIEKSRTCPKDSPHADNQEPSSYRFPQALISQKLNSGLRGWIHGVAVNNSQYVFTYRSEDSNDPMAFFKAEEFSLVTRDPNITKILQGLHRHDEVILKGRLLTAPTPLRHIAVTELEIKEPYQHSHKYNYEIEESIFAGKDTVKLLTKVHAVIADGQGLVLEYKDMILPVFVSEAHHQQTANIYRNDKLHVALKIKRGPGRPLHFYTNPDVEKGLEVIDSIQHCHKLPTTLEGTLVKFSQSPQITRDIYAIKVVDPNGIARNFTFFPQVDFSQPGANDTFMKLFEAISSKSAEAWEESGTTSLKARNHEHQPRVKVIAKGVLNIVSKSQANPQVYLTHVNNLSFVLVGEEN